MKSKMLLMMALLGVLTSCEQDEIPLGDRFVLCKDDGIRRYFSGVGLEVTDGGTQNLIQGEKIESYGSNATHVVIKKGMRRMGFLPGLPA